MKKHFYCLFSALLLMTSQVALYAATPEATYAGCCKPPYDKTVTCDFLPANFNPHNTQQLQHLFGKAENKCFPGLWVELTPIVSLSNCQSGTIIRRFKASNRYGGHDECTQKVTIVGVHDYKLRFPEDVELTCGQAPAQEQVIVEQSSCDYLVVSVQDMNFFGNNSQCGKIFRTYRVINWCEYDGYSQPQIIGRDEDCDGKPGDEAVWVIRRPSGHAFIDRDHSETNQNPRAGERFTCSLTNPTGYWRKTHSTGYWQYTQHIKISDDVPPLILLNDPEPFCSVNNNCTATVSIPFSVSDICTPNDIKIKVFINGIKTAEYSKGGPYTAGGVYPIGTHQLEIHAVDGCGNATSRKTTFRVVDCKAPAPICLNGLTITLMPTEPGAATPAAMSIWAEDLIASPLSDCSGIAGFSINRVGETPDFQQKELILTCDDLGTLDIEVYAWDKANNPYAVQPDGSVGGPNFTFCRTYLLVQINNNLCDDPDTLTEPDTGLIAGRIYTEEDFSLSNVSVMLISADSTMRLTSETGDFRFEALMGQAYTLKPFFDDYHAEGISIADLIILQKHVLGIEAITSPYRLIAADVNRDGQVDAADVDELRSVMLGLQPVFLQNTSWRFVDAAYVFPNPLNPWQEPFPESVRISEMSSPENYSTFIAIKIGDLNGSLLPDRVGAAARHNATRSLSLPNLTLAAQQTWSIPVYGDFRDLAAAQFALQYNANALELLSIEPGLITAEHYFIQADAGVVNIVWDGIGQPIPNTDQPLLTLRVRASTTTSTAESLQLNERYLRPQAYGQNAALYRLALTFEAAQMMDLQLAQNYPNPFREETTIGFYLPETAPISLNVYSMQGQLLKTISGQYAAGYHQVQLRGMELPTTGLLLYTLDTPTQRLSRKMLLMR